MKENIENMTIVELVEKARARVDDYLLDAGAVIRGLDAAKGVIGDTLEDAGRPDEADLLYVLAKCMDKEHGSFCDDISDLFVHLITAVNEPEKKGAVKS